MADEFDDLIDENGVEITAEHPVALGVDGEVTRPNGLPPEPPPQSLPAGMSTARDLLPPDADEDEGDFEPGGLYKGFRIIPPHLWPDEPSHARWPSRFYVSTDRDTPGLVPWPGSQIVWPWERGWQVDLHRTEVQSFLKEEKKEKKR